MKKKDQLDEFRRRLQFQQSLLNLCSKCSQPEPTRKRPLSASAKALGQLARKVEAQAG